MRFALATTLRKLQLEVDANTTTDPVKVHVSYNQWFAKDTFASGSQNTSISTTTITDICDAPIQAMPKEIEMINVYNPDTVDHVITLYYYDNGTRYIIWKGNLASGSTYTQSATGAGMITDDTGSAQWSAGDTGGGGAPSFTAILLNHFDVADGGTTFTDEIAGVSWFKANDTQGDTAQSKFGGSSIYMPTPRGAGPDNAHATGFVIPVGVDFTAECFVRSSATALPFFKLITTSDDTVMRWRLRSATVIDWTLVTDVIATGFLNQQVTISWGMDEWHHLALSHDTTLNEWNFYYDGVRIDTYIHTTAENERISNKLLIGADDGDNVDIWFDEIRIVLGLPYNGGTYTVPTAPFTP